MQPHYAGSGEGEDRRAPHRPAVLTRRDAGSLGVLPSRPHIPPGVCYPPPSSRVNNACSRSAVDADTEGNRPRTATQRTAHGSKMIPQYGCVARRAASTALTDRPTTHHRTGYAEPATAGPGPDR